MKAHTLASHVFTFLSITLLLFNPTHASNYQAIIAVGLSMNSAQAASSAVAALLKEPRNKGGADGDALRDCSASLGGATDDLKKSLRELQGDGSMKSVKGWVGAALEGENECLAAAKRLRADLKSRVQTQVSNAQELTSYAVQLVNMF